MIGLLFQIPQRYRFSSKSQRLSRYHQFSNCCFRYHKGTDFQANHNKAWGIMEPESLFQIPQRYRFSSKSQQRNKASCHLLVVLDTTKVQIFKQITTENSCLVLEKTLFQIPQRYRFSSKSQLHDVIYGARFCCFRYHKGTDFQANHNKGMLFATAEMVVLDTTKVQIFKQITTVISSFIPSRVLFQIPQRYRFSSKSQHALVSGQHVNSCFRYHKGTDFQANHNLALPCSLLTPVVLDTTKVQIFKQITTFSCWKKW